MKLESIRALIEAATPGPWEPGEHEAVNPLLRYWFLVAPQTSWDELASEMKEGDARFIAASRTLMPKLLSLVETARDLHIANMAKMHPQAAPEDYLGSHQRALDLTEKFVFELAALEAE